MGVLEPLLLMWEALQFEPHKEAAFLAALGAFCSSVVRVGRAGAGGAGRAEDGLEASCVSSPWWWLCRNRRKGADRGRFKVGANISPFPSPVSPSCKTDLVSGCFSALWRQRSRRGMGHQPWRLRLGRETQDFLSLPVFLLLSLLFLTIDNGVGRLRFLSILISPAHQLRSFT